MSLIPGEEKLHQIKNKALHRVGPVHLTFPVTSCSPNLLIPLFRADSLCFCSVFSHKKSSEEFWGKVQREKKTKNLVECWNNSVQITLCSTSHGGAICYFVTHLCFAWQVTRKWNKQEKRRRENVGIKLRLSPGSNILELTISSGPQRRRVGVWVVYSTKSVPVQSPAPWAGPPSFTCLTKMVSIGSRRFRCLPGNKRGRGWGGGGGHMVRKSSRSSSKIRPCWNSTRLYIYHNYQNQTDFISNPELVLLTHQQNDNLNWICALLGQWGEGRRMSMRLHSKKHKWLQSHMANTHTQTDTTWSHFKNVWYAGVNSAHSDWIIFFLHTQCTGRKGNGHQRRLSQIKIKKAQSLIHKS